MEGGSIAVVMEDIQTRTAVTDEGAFTWSAGDQIWLEITANPGYVTGTLSSGAGAGRANFAYGTYFGDMTGKAVYPFNAGHDVNGNELSVVLPASYDLGSNLSNTNAAMYGVETNGSIKFNHLAGVMRFKFINAPVGTDKFIITLDKKINGTFTPDLTEDYPVLQTETTSNESEKSITLNFDALTSVQDIMLYVPLPLGTYTTLGLEVKAGSQSVWTYSNTVTNTIKRKSLILMPSVTLAGSVSGDIEGGETPSVPDGGDSDYMQYIVYNGTGNNNNTVISGDSSWNLEPFFYSRVSDINEIELKFQMGPSSANPYDSEMRWLFSSERPYVNNGVRLSADGLVLRYNNSGYNVVTNEKIITWDEMDASITDKIVLNISVSQKKITVNCREISVPELETFTDIEYLFSSYYYINDDGYAKNYVTVPVESKLYYAKIWNTSGSLLYHGYASEGEKSEGNTQPVWKSEYNGTTYLEFPNTNFQSFWVSTYTSNWLPFGGGIDVDDTPSVSDAVDLSAAGTANSYIVSEAGSYKFVPTKGNSSESVGAISSVEVLWETFGTSETPSVGSLISNVRYEGGDIFFDTPETFKEGNAVIAAKDASGAILWSWHIWLTDQPQEQVYYNNAGTMMARNLGATSATPGDVGALGLLYQWGRKDPFLGSSSISSSTEAKSTLTWPSAVSSDSSNGTIDYAIEHPTTFIKRNQNNNDWYDTGSSVDNTRWTTSETLKSVYDPCPGGWRVPDGGSKRSWSKAFGSSSIFPDASLYDSTNKGINFSGIFCDVATIWYPVSGYRNSYDGTLSAVGSNGYCWSASPTPQNFSTYGASLLVFGTGSNVTLDAGSDRSNGFSVRCVKENSSSDLPTEPETPAEPDLSQPSYSVQLNPATYGWVKSTSVSNPDASLYDGVYESTNQGMSNTKSIMYIDINGYDEFTIYVRSYADSYFDYVEVSNLDVNITYRTSGFKMTTSGNQQSGTSISSYTEVKFTNIGGGQHRIMVAYKKDYSYNENDDKGYVLIPKNKGSQTPSSTDLSSNGTANSYIVSEAGSYKFTPTKGNSSESVGAISSVDVLWETFGTSETPSVGSLISSVSYADGKIGFSTPQSYREGNAVIAAKDVSGTILWSWHIWLTDQPEEQVYYNNAGTMMDRNLGATSATPGDVGALGLLYQWGRKDPFLGSSSISSSTESKSTITWPSTVSSNSSNGTVEYATSHPTTFITYNDSNCDWYYTGSNSTNDTRWQSEKTIYDPCPVGWRVPDGGANGVWSTALGSSSSNSGTYDSTNKGINFSSKFGFASTIWYPALGSRYDDSGRYWSVTPGNDLANGLSFDCYGNVLPSSCGFRASGFGVRCQKEGTGGGLQIDVTTAKDLSALGTANSYIVSNKGTYSISAVKGNSGVSVGAITSVEVLWESYGTDEKPLKGSLVSCAKYENGKVYFKTSDTYREGNAVIAAKDASGEILWSWHIWLTDQPEEQEYYNNAGTMMDRNLGATSATPGDVGALGLLYQWGRKDPFLGSSSISSGTEAKSTITWPSVVSSNTTNGTIEYATSHPTTFITYNSSNYDWYYTGSSSTDNTRWQSEKTIYDPCPVGWRVPDGGSNGVWSTALGSSSDFANDSLYDSTNEGINFSGRFGSASTIWYPASGCRYYDDRSLYSVGSYGSYWSASPNGSGACLLDFGNGGYVYPSYDNARAYGYSVRCLQE